MWINDSIQNISSIFLPEVKIDIYFMQLCCPHHNVHEIIGLLSFYLSILNFKRRIVYAVELQLLLFHK